MFDRIARVYDGMNSVMTVGTCTALARARGRPGGGGARQARARRGHRHRRPGDSAARPPEVVGRLRRACSRSAAARPDVRFETGNALELPYGEDEVDAVTVGFGARSYADLDRGLAEMTRVTAPGGRVVVLEITTPQRPPLSWFFRIWFDRVVPRLGRLAGDPDAYSYLPSSVRRFPARTGWRRWWRRAWAKCAGSSPPAASSRCTPGPRREHGPESAQEVLAAGGRSCRGCCTGPRRGWRRWPSYGPGSRALGGHPERRQQAAAPAARVPLRGQDAETALRAAVAVELLHMATLVHDDVLDRVALGAGARPCSPTAVRPPPPPPATCSSRARSRTRRGRA